MTSSPPSKKYTSTPDVANRRNAGSRSTARRSRFAEEERESANEKSVGTCSSGRQFGGRWLRSRALIGRACPRPTAGLACSVQQRRQARRRVLGGRGRTVMGFGRSVRLSVSGGDRRVRSRKLPPRETVHTTRRTGQESPESPHTKRRARPRSMTGRFEARAQSSTSMRTRCETNLYKK